MTLAATAEAIADTYLAQLPPDYASRYSAIADPDTLQTLFRGFNSGLKVEDCCLAAGISPRTFRRWTDLAEADPNSAYGLFDKALKAQRAAGKNRLLERIARAGNKDQHWTANAWLLERTDPEQFALRKDTESGPKVLVQIGSSLSDITVNVVTVAQDRLGTHNADYRTPTPIGSTDSLCKTQLTAGESMLGLRSGAETFPGTLPAQVGIEGVE